jgi:hypothetical protein
VNNDFYIGGDIIFLGNGAGHNEFTGRSGMKLYPNPADETLHVSIPSAEAMYSLSIMDTQGKCVSGHRALAGSGSTVDIAVGHLPPGPYVLVCISESTFDSRLFIKK